MWGGGPWGTFCTTTPNSTPFCSFQITTFYDIYELSKCGIYSDYERCIRPFIRHTIQAHFAAAWIRLVSLFACRLTSDVAQSMESGGGNQGRN